MPRLASRFASFSLVVACLSVTLVSGQARAYTIGTGFTTGCHERITARAFGDLLAALAEMPVPLPDDDEWKKVAEFLARNAGADPDSLSDQELFLLHSLLVGVRAPDTNGHSVLNLERARATHTDPAPLGQYMHALRAASDDFAIGDRVAVAGTRAVLIDEFAEFRRRMSDEPLKEVEIYFDFYGTVEVDVFAPAFHIGQAAHTLQDSFSHSIRDEADGFRSIVSVLNYADAVVGSLDEERDGIAHSTAMDSCGVRTEPVVEACVVATTALFEEARSAMNGEDARIEDVLDEWVRLRESCDASNDFCDNLAWVELARSEPTGPLLCRVGWHHEGRSAWGEVYFRGIAIFWLLRTVRRRRRRRIA